MDRIELLSPAGDYNCFLAAINAGADAVYLSGEKFGARAYAKNFSTEELIKAIDYAHIFNRKVYLTVNTLLKDDEIAELFDYLLPFYKTGLDGVIVQDMGVISYIREKFSDLPVHASTQLAITGLEGIKLLEELGVKRTVLAREVSMKEIEYIHNNSSMEIETFVHGALCYSYSGKCLFSSLVGGRSGNRGRCAGSCRQPYNNDKYLLSTKDICCLSIIPEMINAGICSLKIEGRMKSPEYVAGVTSIYRKYIDLYYENIDRMTSEEISTKFFSGSQFMKDNEILTRLYTRGGNSKGYYYKHNGKEMISISDASYTSDKGEIKASVNEKLISETERIGINGYVRIYPDEKMSILINNEFYYEGNVALVANNRPLDVETVRKQLCKTKDTEFEFTEIDFDIADNAFVRVSDLNELRRNAINYFRDCLLAKYRREYVSDDCDKQHVNPDCVVSDNAEQFDRNRISINCEVSNIDQFETILQADKINSVYIPINIVIKQGLQIIDEVKKYNKRVYIKFQSVIRYNYLEKNRDQIIEIINAADGVLADSHEVISFLNNTEYEKEIIGDVHIYALNKYAAATYKEQGLDTLTVPVELNKKELYKRAIKGEELVIYGRLPMMVSAQCINNTINGCDKQNKNIVLKDRKGAEFIAVNNCFDCSNVIYNNVPLCLQGEEEFISKISPKSFRIIFTVEDKETVKKVCEYFTDNGDDRLFSDYQLLNNNSFTKGHLNRGVL